MTGRIAKLEVAAENAAGGLPSFLENERAAALRDILATSHFLPHNDNNGPYGVALSVMDGRLVIDIADAQGRALPGFALSLKPYSRLVRDYFLMIESYEQARLTATREKLEALDMGRRGLHNEGADLFRQRLEGKIDVDHETARRFFTLICILHRTQAGFV